MLDSLGRKAIGRTAGLLYTLGGFAALLTAPIVWAGESGYWTAVNVASCRLLVVVDGRLRPVAPPGSAGTAPGAAAAGGFGGVLTLGLR